MQGHVGRWTTNFLRTLFAGTFNALSTHKGANMLEMYEEPIEPDFTLRDLTTDELLRLLHEVADELERRRAE